VQAHSRTGGGGQGRRQEPRKELIKMGKGWWRKISAKEACLLLGDKPMGMEVIKNEGSLF
jgi:hypothetical protein